MPSNRQTEVLDVAGEFRRAYSEYRSDFDIGGNGRYLPTPRGVNVNGSGADYHYKNELQFWRAIERARAFDRNNMIVSQAVNRLTANLVQDGFTPDPATGSEDLDKALKEDWADWSSNPERCDYEGEKTFHEMELIATRSIPIDGDIFCLPLNTGKLQWLEAHRCRRPRTSRNKNNVHGITCDAQTAERTQYWFTKEDIDPLGSVANMDAIVPVDARDADGQKQVLHLYWPGRFSQRRGVTAFAPIALPVQYHDDIQFANLVAAQAQSCYAFLEQDLVGTGPQLPAPTGAKPAKTGSETVDTFDDGTARTRQGLSPGMRVPAPPGRSIQGFSPTIPGPQFESHTMIVLSIIGINLDLPLIVLMLDGRATNFSGWRGAIDQSRIRFRVLQNQQARRFYQPIWRWRVRQLIARSPSVRKLAAQTNVRPFLHEWHPPTWSYIEPHKDISANALELATFQTSPSAQRNRQGEQFDQIAPAFINDAGLLLKLAEEKAQELNKQLGTTGDKEITRQELLHLFTAGGRSVTATDEPTPEPAAASPTSKRGAA